MKIQCDVCDKDEASVFCVADEAALCAACDHRVHHANKLAGKHHRFSLDHPSPKQTPLCDICKERRAFLFCHQDRAIMCQDCDIRIHKANEHTKNHTRFLLTGLKLSETSTLYSSSSQSPAESASSNSKSTTLQSGGVAAPQSCDNDLSINTSTSSISEYLIETLPGWHVQDFLDSSFLSPYAFSKNGDINDDVLGLLDNKSAFPMEKNGIWVPQFPPPLNQNQKQKQKQSYQSMELAFGTPNGTKELITNNNIKSTRKWSEDSSFIVPEISQNLNSSKRSRSFW